MVSGKKLQITINGETRSLKEWCDIYGVKYTTAFSRLQKGWYLEYVFRKGNKVSATNRGGVRSKNDFYPTPEWLIRAVLPYVLFNKDWYANNKRSYSILEPAAGDGAIVRAIHSFIDENEDYQVPHTVSMFDIDPQDLIRDKCNKADFLEVNPLPKFDLIITNPPFTLCQEFIERSLEWTRDETSKVVMLLREGFLSTQKRVDFFKQYWPKETYTTSKRPKFLKGRSSDSCEYCWAVFTRENTQIESGMKYAKRFLLDTRGDLKNKK